MFQPVPLQDEDRRADARAACAELWGIEERAFVLRPPSSQPRTLMRADARTIRTQAHNYVVGLKTNGVRMFLLAVFTAQTPSTNNNNNVPDNDEQYIVLVGRDGSVYDAHGLCCRDPAVYDGTLIDGELLPTGEYVAFDVIAAKGYDTKPLPFLERLEHMRDACSLIFTDKSSDAPRLRVVVKTWTPLHTAPKIYDSTNPDCDGVIVAHIEDPYDLSTMARTYKWKPAHEHTIDFGVEIDRFSAPPSVQLWLCRTNATVLSIEASGDFASHVGTNGHGAKSRLLVECRLEERCARAPHESRWVAHFVRLRTDKRKPNSAYVAKMTLRTIRENVHLTELVAKKTTVL